MDEAGNKYIYGFGLSYNLEINEDRLALFVLIYPFILFLNLSKIMIWKICEKHEKTVPVLLLR
jgi:hypothetical protein